MIDPVSDTGAVSSPSPDARPFASWRGAIEWWYRPVVLAETWVALGYLAVGALWSAVVFVAAVVVFSITFALVLVFVGLFLIVPTFALVDAMCGVERRRASWVGQRIAPRSLRPASGSGRPSIRSATSTLTDPERWRQVAFICCYLLVAPLLFAVAVTPWSGLLGLFFATVSDPSSVDVLAVIAGLVLAGAAPRITTAVAGVNRSFVAWFLGPDPTVELQDRVDELADQRTLILEAVAAERRRIERDLHDGVQQQLVALGIDIGRAQSRLADDPAAARKLLDDALVKVRGAVGELRVIGRGLHPAVLADRGLDAALSSIVAGASVPITIDVALADDLPDDVAATAYYVVNEAVANVLKHAGARAGSVRVADGDGDGRRTLAITVRDDGCGGADPTTGTGLAGIRARVEGADGVLRIDSPVGGPTTLVAMLPVQSLRRPLPPPRPAR